MGSRPQQGDNIIAISDYFTGTTNGSRPEPTTVTGVRAISGTTLQCNALTGWEAVQPVHFVTYKIDANGDKIAGSQCDWKGIVSGTTLTQLTLKAGTDVGNAIGDVVVCMPTAAWAEDLVTGILVQHNQDGTHAAVTATSVNVSGTVTTNTIAEKTAANGVAIDGMSIKDGKVVGGSAVGVANSSLDTTAGEPGGAWKTWSPTFGGFSADPTGGIYRYMQLGKSVFIHIRQPNAGTSNATTFTITLPVTAKTTANDAWAVPCRVENAGTTAITRMAVIDSGGTVVQFGVDGTTTGGFTASGNKRCYNLEMVYEAA